MLVLYPQQQFFNSSGGMLSGGKVFFYQPGTSTPKSVYSDSTGVTPLANPVILDSVGRASMWLNGVYKVIIQDSNGVQISSNDNVSFSPFQTQAGASEWLLQSLTNLTFVSATQFTAANDQTPTFQVNRRIQATVTAGTVYGTITASSYALGVTTVTVTWDSGSLDSGLSAVSVGILAANNESVPANIPTNASIQAGTVLYGADSGAADAYVVTLNPAPSAYTLGMEFNTKLINGNLTTTPTINVNSLGAKTIVRPDGSAMIAGDIRANWNARFRYNGTNMILLNPYYQASLISSGTFTLTLTGCTTSPTGTAYYSQVGQLISIAIPTITGTSNSVTAGLTGLPASLQSNTISQFCLSKVEDNGVINVGTINIGNSNLLGLSKDISGNAFTSSGTKGVQACTISYFFT